LVFFNTSSVFPAMAASTSFTVTFLKASSIEAALLSPFLAAVLITSCCRWESSSKVVSGVR